MVIAKPKHAVIKAAAAIMRKSLIMFMLPPPRAIMFIRFHISPLVSMLVYASLLVKTLMYFN